MLVTGSEYSPMNSFALVESKSLTHIRKTANSGQHRAKDRFSFQTGLNLKIPSFDVPFTFSIPIVVHSSRPNFALVAGNAKNLNTHVGVHNAAASWLGFWQILATNDLLKAKI